MNKKFIFVLLFCLMLCCCAEAKPESDRAAQFRDIEAIFNGRKGYQGELNGSKCYVQEFDADLDGDGKNENIKVYFEENHLFVDEPENFIYSQIRVFVTPDGGEPLQFDVYGDNVRASVRFDYFDENNPLLSFYIEEEGPSADPATHIFWYTDGEIQYMLVRGFITGFDGKGNIYTNYNYLMTNEPQLRYSSYVLGKGLEPYDKSELIGKEISFSEGYPLVVEPNYIVARIMGSYYSECKEMVIEELGDNFSVFLEAGEDAEIVDFYCETSYDDENVYITEPWLQLKTADGKIGWIRLVSGD